MRKIIEFSEWSRCCPSCNNIIYYSTKYKMDYATKSISLCPKCKYSKISKSLLGKKLSDDHKNSLKSGWLKRKNKGYIHPFLGKHHTEETKRKMVEAKQKYKPFLGKHHTEETKRKISEKQIGISKPMKEETRLSMIGRKLSDNHKLNISLSLKGHKTTNETKLKISQKIQGIKRNENTKEKNRINTINLIKKLGISRIYNPKACEFMDEYGQKNGYSFQHAQNGGEVEIAGYCVDGYDKNKNVVFEYDEIKHEYSKRKEKDLEREKRIIDKLNCEVIRYSEKYNKIYKSYPTYFIIL